MSRTTVRATFRAAAIGTTVVAVLAACGGSGGSGGGSGPSSNFKPGVLDKQYSGTAISVLVPSWAALPQSAVQQFTSQTGIKVQEQTLDFNAVHDKIVTAEAAGNAPADVTEMDWTWVAQFSKAGWYADLSKYLPAKTISSDTGHAIFDASGKQVAVPYNLDFRGTVVNMTMLKKAGITQAPTTWQQVLDDAKALQAKGVVKYPVGIPLSVTEGSATPWYALTRATGANILTSSGAPAFSSPNSGGSKALNFIKTLYQSKYVDPGSINLQDTDVNDEFTSGRAAIVISGSPGLLSTAKSDSSSNVKSDDVTFTAVPGENGPASKLIGLQEGLGIPANAPHPEAAAEFLYWWMQTSQEVTAYTAPGLGNVPSQSSALNQLVSQNKLLGGSTILSLSKKVGPVFNGPAPTWYSDFSTDVAAMLQSVAEGHESVSAGIAKLASQTKALQNSGK